MRLYARDRNFVKPGHPAVSRLSPLIRHRLLLESEVADAAVAAHGFGRVEKFVQEVYWRRYWKSWLALRPQVWSEACAFAAPSADSPQGEKALAVMAGESGNRLIDFFTRELLETGYLHNHARMWYAAWWIHQARLPWQWGAGFFMSHLLDGDPASNTLSWRWVAGLQTPGKTYLARRANLEKYLDDRILEAVGDALADFESPAPHLPDAGQFVRTGGVDVERGEIAVSRPRLQHVADSPTGLWIHEEDLVPEVSPMRETRIDSVLVAGHLQGWKTHGYSDLRKQWLDGALADAACRATSHWRVPTRVEHPEDMVGAILSWVADAGLAQIVAIRPDVGPLADSLPGIRQALDAAGVSLVLYDRPEDLALRPLAKRGFFNFWKKLSSRLSDEPDLFAISSGFSNDRGSS